ncbi:hypothetical protein QFC19_005030 [Naganishia cerealis]|uniref:Uncharacterized protein n=1 Tax=Naganishia cerealis TaxID=610337 RepID=A0ACC2VRA7_9TREE|nr:hypothetical protein QFC19_005030 [Naganishia cerealis]
MDAVEEQPQEEISGSELKNIKKQLRSMQKQAEEDNLDTSRITAGDLVEQLAASDRLFSRRKYSRDPLPLIPRLTFWVPFNSLGTQMLEDLDMDEGGEIPAVRQGGKLGNWAKVGWLAARRSRRAPGVEFMNGMMAIEHKKRIVNRKARQQQHVGPEVRPQEIRQEDMTKAANPTITNTKALATLLEGQDPDGVNFFEWVVNPRSFGQTVENMFYTSFLVREGIAAIDVRDDGSGIPIIFACDPPSEEDKRAQYDEEGNVVREALARRQVVMEMTMDVWQEAIELFNIKKGIIPDREEEAEQKPGASGWYA